MMACCRLSQCRFIVNESNGEDSVMFILYLEPRTISWKTLYYYETDFFVVGLVAMEYDVWNDLFITSVAFFKI